ncbi:DNA-binding protein [Alkalihalobacillus sp. 1P02AB]|uniref:DNA-binding protein n=1 Tax=Alkalihalobacillus sp. 1P02AB TaxID=3132260 RepID=UPI0039A5E8D2
MDSFWFAIAIIGAAYLIGDGLKNFKSTGSASSNSNADSNNKFGTDDINFLGAPELIKESKIQNYIGISKEDEKSLVKDYPSVPHIIVNGQVYFPTSKLKKWINEIPNNQ